MPRKAVSNAEKRALRTWYKQQDPRPTQKRLVEWFQQTYGRTLNQSSVSAYLSDKFAFLDTLDPETDGDRHALSSQRRQTPSWPTLEKILHEWLRATDSRGLTVTGNMIVEKARILWQRLPEYSENQTMPEFSNGWLRNFRRRHQIKRQKPRNTASTGPDMPRDEAGDEEVQSNHSGPDSDVLGDLANQEFPDTTFIDPDLADTAHVPVTDVSPDEALEALQTVLLFLRRQLEADASNIRTFETLERSLRSKVSLESRSGLFPG